MSTEKLVIERIGHRGEGVARLGERLIFIPYALAGETVVADVEGDHARLIEIVEASKDRVAPVCGHYGVCGGCAAQALAPDPYAEWKRGLVVAALRNAGVSAEVAPLIDAHGVGRRRVTFHARGGDGRTRVGFMEARSHEIVEIDACPLLEPGLAPALPAARALAKALASNGKPLDIAATLTLDGLDIDLRGPGALSEGEAKALITVAERHDLARLSNHGRVVALRRKPRIAVGEASVALPPGSFLQATTAGEVAIASHVLAAVGKSKRVADLFCGLGAFALRLAEHARVSAYDNDAEAIAAVIEAARARVGSRLAEAEARDLFRRPLDAGELSRFDAVVFDPPRAGAAAQAEQLAKSSIDKVVAVSCDARSFARDAGILVAGGFALGEVTPIDQFRFSPHVETVAAFSRAARPVRKRGLLSR
ncbi:MAG: methyltransferase [Methylocystis sp.]